jgi:hypothetical protein
MMAFMASSLRAHLEERGMASQDSLRTLREELTDLASSALRLEDIQVWTGRTRKEIARSRPEALAQFEQLLPRLENSARPRVLRRQLSSPEVLAAESPSARIDSTSVAALVGLLDHLLLTGQASPQRSRAGRFRPTPWVFISSVKEGAAKYRQMAINACLRRRMLPVGMESWTAANKAPDDICKQAVRESDLVVLLLVNRYGSIDPKSGKSFTELEYAEAVAAKKDVLAFSVTPEAGVQQVDPEDLMRYQSFSQAVGLKTVAFVDGPAELEARVFQALVEWEGPDASGGG